MSMVGKTGKPYYADYGYAKAAERAAARPEYATIVDWIPPRSRVIDLGCGDGSLGQLAIAEKEASVVGLEIDAVAVARARAAGLDVRVADVDEGLPFAPDAFDLAVMNVTLSYVYRPRFVLEEMLRVAPVAIVSFPNLAHWTCRLDLLLAGRFPRRVLYGHPWHASRLIHPFSYSDFRRLVRELGAAIRRRRCLGWDSRHPGWLAGAWPNLFAMVPILQIERGHRAA